jgi:hypothetical protein
MPTSEWNGIIMIKPKLAVTDNDEPIAELASNSDHEPVTIWAAECAERVLPYFENNYADDTRPREAIEAGRAWVRGELEMTEAREAAFSAHAAARDTDDDAAAYSAARATGHAAATAHVPSHAVHAARYAATAVRDADNPVDTSTTAAEERNWQYHHLLEL